MGPVELPGSSSEGLASRMLQTGLLVDKYYTPLVCLFGALGNSLSLAVFLFDSKYRSQSSSYYLSALAVSDTGFLINLFAVWLENFYSGVITSDIMCPLVMYLGQVTCFISVYLTVAFSIERYVAVHYPFSRPSICTRAKAKKVILAITVIALIMFSYVWIIAKVMEIKPLSTLSSDTHQKFAANLSDQVKIVKNIGTNETLLGDLTNHRNHDVGKVGAEIENHDISTIPVKLPKEDASKKWFHSKNNGHKSMKMGQQETPDVREQMRHQYFINLIEDNGAMEERKNKQNGGMIPKNSRETSSNDDYIKLFPESPSNITATMTSQYDLNLNLTNKSDPSCRYRCTVPKHYFKISEIANYLDTAFTLIIPFFLITYFNVRISIFVWKLKDQWQQTVTSHLMSKSKMMVVTDNRQGSRNLQSHTHTLLPDNRNSGVHGGIRKNHFEENVADNNEVCYGRLQRQKETVDVKVENVSGGICRFKSTSTLKENETEAALNEAYQGPFDTGKPILRGSGDGDDSDQKCDLYIFRRGDSQTGYHHSSSEVRVTKTLLLVSGVFLVLNLPLHAIRCTQFLQSVTGTQEGKEILRALQPWANLLFNTNFAVNFLLYCASGRNFHKSLKHITPRVLRTKPRQRPSLKPSSHHSHSTRRQTEQNVDKTQNWRRRRSSTPERTGTTNISKIYVETPLSQQ